jgi:hypothetical protein
MHDHPQCSSAAQLLHVRSCRAAASGLNRPRDASTYNFAATSLLTTVDGHPLTLCHPVAFAPCRQAQEAADARISDLQSTLAVCHAGADNLRDLLSQAELQRREAERQAAIANAAGGQQHRCGHRLRMVGSLPPAIIMSS